MISYPNVAKEFAGQFPADFVNRFPGWGCFDRQTVDENKGKLLMLDLDFGKECGFKCKHCFRRSPGFQHKSATELRWNEVTKMILEAKKLGLREVKILGAGETFQNPRFLGFLRFLDSQDIYTAVFTRGNVIGDDALCQEYNGHYGITTGKQLAEELYKLKVSIIVSFNSRDNQLQDDIVGCAGYSNVRNRAIELLAEQGFNAENPTRLAIGMSPTTTWNIEETYENYVWARERNIYTVVCPTMCSGYSDTWRETVPSQEALVDLYTKIYRFNLDRGIQTLDQLRYDGISAYAGTAPCNQVACGMYVTLNGIVHSCPGDDVTELGDIRQSSLMDIWVKSPNFRRAGTYNCGCPAKTNVKEGRCSIPPSLFSRVIQNLREA